VKIYLATYFAAKCVIEARSLREALDALDTLDFGDDPESIECLTDRALVRSPDATAADPSAAADAVQRLRGQATPAVADVSGAATSDHEQVLWLLREIESRCGGDTDPNEWDRVLDAFLEKFPICDQPLGASAAAYMAATVNRWGVTDARS
jgi:hypothetical protein